jgi:aminomethyltransferase
VADKKTALFEIHRQMGARLVPFGGWSMPVEYSGIVSEHTAVRTTAGLFDVSHMGEFEVTGAGAMDLLQRVTCNDVSRLADGQAQYSALPTPEGAVVDDLLVYRESAGRFLLVVNAANIQTDFEWITAHNSGNAQVTDVSDATSLLAVQGPRAAEILQPLAEPRVDRLRAYHFLRAQVAGVPTLVSRTGYTGEDGFELYFASTRAETVWNALLERGKPLGLVPAGLGARNTLRLEARLLLYGNDIDRTTSLLEAGLGWITKFAKGDFIGRQALLLQQSAGLQRKLVGFEMLGREIARDHYPVRAAGAAAGHVTSGAPSITLKKNIGLTYLPVQHAATGSRFEVMVRGRGCEAQVVETPFYKRKSA